MSATTVVDDPGTPWVLYHVSDGEITVSDGEIAVVAGLQNIAVTGVTWYGAAAFCDWLSLQAGLPTAYDHENWSCPGGDPYGAIGYRLSTEAEWEYACRAGSVTAFSAGGITDEICDDPLLDLIGWYCGNAAGQPRPVGLLPANAWGLHDMHGGQ